jgi:hypothetical protein
MLMSNAEIICYLKFTLLYSTYMTSSALLPSQQSHFGFRSGTAPVIGNPTPLPHRVSMGC